MLCEEQNYSLYLMHTECLDEYGRGRGWNEFSIAGRNALRIPCEYKPNWDWPGVCGLPQKQSQSSRVTPEDLVWKMIESELPDKRK